LALSNSALSLEPGDVKDWIEDIKFYRKQLKLLHIDLYHTLNKTSFNEKLDKLVTTHAAMSNAAQFRQLLNAKLVGQPTGAQPSGYQDMGQFELPNSSLAVTYSKRLFRFSDESPDALYPNMLIPLTRDDYLKPGDKVLDWVLSDIRDRKSSHAPD